MKVTSPSDAKTQPPYAEDEPLLSVSPEKVTWKQGKRNQRNSRKHEIRTARAYLRATTRNIKELRGAIATESRRGGAKDHAHHARDGDGRGNSYIVLDENHEAAGTGIEGQFIVCVHFDLPRWQGRGEYSW